jgi:hypothetical protein
MDRENTIPDGNGGRIDLDRLSERELLIVTAKQFADFRDREFVTFREEIRTKFKLYDDVTERYVPLFERHLASHRTLYLILVTAVPLAAFLADLFMRLFS